MTELLGGGLDLELAVDTILLLSQVLNLVLPFDFLNPYFDLTSARLI